MQRTLFILPLLLATTLLAAPPATTPATQPAKTTLAVLPFVAPTAAERKLADRMRFAVSQKLSRDGSAAGPYDRKDTVDVDHTISALQIPFTDSLPDDDELAKVVDALGSQQVILGEVKGRHLTVHLYQDGKKLKSVSADIPPDTESPKLTVEKLLTDLVGTKFIQIREQEVDHNDKVAEKLWQTNPNLVQDPGFEDGPKVNKPAAAWGAILAADRYAPPVLTLEEAQKLSADRVAVVPKKMAGDPTQAEGHCLMLRMSKNIAENNGLACESTWISVENGKKYRFSCQYRSTGPVPRLFLKGFAYKPDQFGDKNDPESVRREYYRAQVLPRKANDKFELIEMDFTPSVLKDTDPKIEWVRIDLYIYLAAGDVFFDDVVVKRIVP